MILQPLINLKVKVLWHRELPEGQAGKRIAGARLKVKGERLKKFQEIRDKFLLIS